MTLYCQNQNCDFTFEDNTTLQFCPKCSGTHFANVKDAQTEIRKLTGISREALSGAVMQPLIQKFTGDRRWPQS